MILEVLIQNFGAHRRTLFKVFIFKTFQGAQVFFVVVQIGPKLPFTFKNKRRKQIQTLSFKN